MESEIKRGVPYRFMVEEINPFPPISLPTLKCAHGSCDHNNGFGDCLWGMDENTMKVVSKRYGSTCPLIVEYIEQCCKERGIDLYGCQGT